MINPIALAMIALGLVLFVLGILLALGRTKRAGLVVSVLGLVIGSFPLINTFFIIGSNP